MSKASLSELRIKIAYWWEIEQNGKVLIMKSIVSITLRRISSLNSGDSLIEPYLPRATKRVRSCSMARTR